MEEMKNWFMNSQKRELIMSSSGERALDVLIDKDLELAQYAYFKDTIILFVENSYKITTPYLMTKKEVEDSSCKHPFTVPDRLFLCNGNHYAIYVDGPSHLTVNGSKKDDEIDSQLVERGVKVLRLTYTESKRELEKQYNQVRLFVLAVK